MEKNSSKYINLISKNIINRKVGIKRLKYYLLSMVCSNTSIANYQLDQLINNYFFYSNKGLKILDIGSGLCNYYPDNVIESKNFYYAFDLSDELRELIEKRGITFLKGDLLKDKLAFKENAS